ncbi:hypothetical protein HTZ77_39710 [Nonomuraea sp. SMC257]|uniref:Uncharacterized protein n=1 Tax=Nonomuraea montanisoli TaxID=2741721 RepID=A0A7Y6IFW7_9ACTN|nr:hypothetical protein [Nonomuraea montanisoli]NUW37484.1 hypothetical protein [Nonomuraea montanisoli]
MIAGLGVVLAFVGTPRTAQKSTPDNDRINLLTGDASISATPRARRQGRAEWPGEWPADWSGTSPGPASGPAPAPVGVPAPPGPDRWLERVSPPARQRGDRRRPPRLGLPPVMSPWVTPPLEAAAPSVTDTPRESAMPEAPDDPAPAARVAPSPSPVPVAPPHPHATSVPDVADESVAPPEPAERRRQDPEPAERRRPEPADTGHTATADRLPAPDPCATFPDVRRDYCYRLLGGR